MNHTLVLGAALLSLCFTAQAFDPSAGQATSGILDEPVLNPNRPTDVGVNSPTFSQPGLAVAQANGAPARNPNVNSTDPVIRQQAVQETVEQEIEVLEELPIAVVEERANDGERAAQIVLGTEFAREAQSLTGFPAAANQAAEDAVRWYSLAARRGYPGAASLDYAGVSFYPIRVQRARN